MANCINIGESVSHEQILNAPDKDCARKTCCAAECEFHFSKTAKRFSGELSVLDIFSLGIKLPEQVFYKMLKFYPHQFFHRHSY